MDDVIGQLLKAGLLRNLGDDQERANRLRAASVQLCDQYRNSARSRVPSALIAAVDEDTPPDLTILNTARDEIVKQWEMFENAYAQQDPAAILRAVVFDGVIAAARADKQISAAAWYTLRNAAGTVSAGRWSAQVESIAATLGAAVASEIDQLWVPEVDTSSIKMPSVSARGASRAKLTVAGLKEFLEEVQPHLDSDPQQVANLVGRHAPKLLEALLRTVAAHAEAEGKAEAERLREILRALGEKLRGALRLQEQALAAIARRDRLLWWRLGGRSRLLGTGYADAQDPASGAVAAAVDLHRQVPSLAPHAVEDLLVDVLREANLADKDVAIDAMVAAATKMQLITKADAIRPFLLSDVVVGGCDLGGLPSAHADTMSAADAAVRLFQGLQVRRLLAGEDAQAEDS